MEGALTCADDRRQVGHEVVALARRMAQLASFPESARKLALERLRSSRLIKGLSPGINDTTTAVICVGYLTAILARLAPRQVETPFRMDQGQLRVIAREPTFRSLLDEAFDQIRLNSEGNVTVLVRLIQVVNIVAGFTDDGERRQALQLHADLVLEDGRTQCLVASRPGGDSPSQRAS